MRILFTTMAVLMVSSSLAVAAEKWSLATEYEPLKTYYFSHTGPDSTHPDVKSSPPKGASSNLANQATNPAAALIQLQLQNVSQPAFYNGEGYGNQFIIQPVVPFHLSDTGYFSDLIWRGTLPIVTTSNPDGPLDSITELGDMVNLFVPVHKQKLNETTGFEWGPVVALNLPTATSNRTGRGKVMLGPGLLALVGKHDVFTKGDSLQVGGYAYQQWSIAGEGSRPETSVLAAGPVLVYHFNELFGQPGWYTGWTDELMTWNWESNGGGDAQIPVGVRVGRVFNIGDQPVNMFIEPNYNVAHRTGANMWDIKLNLTFLFPG